VPKSSIESPTPSSRMRVSICAACSGFSITSDSVSSSFSVPRATDERDSTVRMSWIKSCRNNCREETLTLAKIDDQADLFGDADELRRRHPAEFRMVPARQGLEACDRTVFQPHDRLVQDGDLLPLDGAAQFALQ